MLLDSDSGKLKAMLSTIKSVDVCVVNLLYKGNHIKNPGFGFLVPTTESNSCDVLGVVYDSCAFPEHLNNENYTSLTVMIGQDALNQKFSKYSSFEMRDSAADTVERILGIPRADLIEFDLQVHKNCIPQYPVNHYKNLQSMEQELAKISNGRAFLVGASYYGVSVNDCIQSGYKVAQKLLN